MSGFEKLENDGTITLTRCDGDFELPIWSYKSVKTVSLVALDLETTGLERDQDEVIEIALRRVTIALEGERFRIVGIGEMYEGLQEPSQPLSKRTKQLTGLTDATLKGQSIGWTEVERILDSADVIVAHNAEFDRGLIDTVLGSNRRLWACTCNQIDWFERGYPAQKLELLSHFHGFYVPAHRAAADVNAMIRLLLDGEIRDTTYLHELLAKAKKQFVRIWAERSPFSAKGQLKARGYKWAPPPKKCWYRDIDPVVAAEENRWLTSQIYDGLSLATVVVFHARDRFRPIEHLDAETTYPNGHVQ